jgi:hypothetical protein
VRRRMQRGGAGAARAAARLRRRLESLDLFN